MTLGSKIQQLRKQKGMTQESLAEQLHVSRQALSKWELGSSVPDIDNIILLSDYFQVTTDYLLRDDLETVEYLHQGNSNGSECKQNDREQTFNGKILFVISGALILIGFMLAWARSNDGTSLQYLSISLAMPGLIIQVIGVALFEVVHIREQGTVKDRILFWGMSSWLLTPIPILYFMGVYFRYFMDHNNDFYFLFLVGVFYLILNVCVSLLCIWQYRRRT